MNLFSGFNITYNIKEGECKRVCCDGGAGGPVKMIPTCNPPSKHSSCTKEKEEDDRCPGDARDVCSSICGSRSAHCASFALVGLLAIAAFFKWVEQLLSLSYVCSERKVSVLVNVSEFFTFEVSGFVVVYIKAMNINVSTKSFIMAPVLTETTWERDQCMRNLLWTQTGRIAGDSGLYGLVGQQVLNTKFPFLILDS